MPTRRTGAISNCLIGERARYPVAFVYRSVEPEVVLKPNRGVKRIVDDMQWSRASEQCGIIGVHLLRVSAGLGINRRAYPSEPSLDM